MSVLIIKECIKKQWKFKIIYFHIIATVVHNCIEIKQIV